MKRTHPMPAAPFHPQTAYTTKTVSPLWRWGRAMLLALLALTLTSTRASYGWSLAQSITNTPVHSINPSAVLDSHGHTHVVWLENVNGNESEDVFYSTNQGGAWQPPRNLSKSAERSFNVQLAILSSDQLLAVWVEMDTFFGIPIGSHVAYAYTSNGVWQEAGALSSTTTAVGVPALAAYNSKIYAVWSAGDDLYGYADHLELAVWQGDQWTAAQRLPINTGYLDMADLSFAPDGQLHLVWNGNQTNTPSNHNAYQIYYSTLRQGVWSSPVNIGNTATYSFYPTIAVDTAGRVHVAWMEEDKGDQGQGGHIFDRILYNRLEGGAWLPTVQSLSPRSGALFPTLAADPRGYVHLLWTNNVTEGTNSYLFRLHYARWDGKTLAGPLQILDAPAPNAGQGMADFVLPASDEVEPQRMAILWAGGDSRGVSQLFYSEQPVNQISLGGITTANIADVPKLVGNAPDQIYAVWVQGSAPGQIVYSHWNGVRWSNPQSVAPTGWYNNAPAAAVGADGTLHVVWHAQDPVRLTDDQTYYSRLTPNGWLAPRLLSDEAALAGTPGIAVDAANNLHVVWQMAPPEAPGAFAVYYRHTSNGGTQWEASERVSLPQHNTNRPQIAVDNQGNPHVVWYDLAEEEIHYATRQNNGWQTVENVSNTPMSAIHNLIISQGPAIAIDTAHQIHVAWVDSVSRTKLDTIYYATRTASGWQRTAVMSQPGQDHSLQLLTGSNVQVIPGANGNLHLLWHDFDQSSALKIYNSNNLGRSQGIPWSSPTILTPTGFNSFHTSGIVDTAGRLHLAWSSSQGGSQIYYQRTDRFDWLKVVDSAGRAMPAAQIYRNGQPVGQSDQRGLLWLDNLKAGDELTALAPVAEYAGVREGHTTPDTPTRNWAYRVYLTNWRYDHRGNPTGAAALAPGSEQLLTVHTERPLILLNLLVSLEWAADEQELQIFTEALRSASAYLFDATNGQIAIGNATIYTASQYWADADIQVRAFSAVRPNAGINGLRALTTTPVRLGRSWSGETGDDAANGAWNLPNGYRTLVHELGHYALGLWDSYFTEIRDANGNLLDTRAASCTGHDIKSNQTDAINATLMDYQYNASELSMRHTSSWSTACEKTQQYAQQQEADWETVRRLFEDKRALQMLAPYPDLQWQIQTPVSTTVLAGPDRFPLLNLPVITTVAPIISTATPLQLLGPPRATQLALVTLYSYQPGGVKAIDQGYTNQTGQIPILGAKDGDRVRVLSRDTTYSGEITLRAGVTNTLVMAATIAAANGAAQSTDSQRAALRYLRLLPKADQRALDLQVIGVGAGASLTGEFSLTGQPLQASVTLAHNQYTNEYRGTLAPTGGTLEGIGQLRVLGADVNDTPVYLASSLSFTTLNAGVDQSVASPDGRLRLLLPAAMLAPGVGANQLLIAEHGGIETTGEAAFGLPVYQLRLAGAQATFNKPVLLTIHANAPLPPLAQPTIVRFDEATATWQTLPTSWDAENLLATAASVQTGFFTLRVTLPPEAPTPTTTPTPTSTSTPLVTETLTPTPLPVVTETSTATPTATATPTLDPNGTLTPTATATSITSGYSLYLPVVTR